MEKHTHKQPVPWYESNLLWGPLALAVAILLSAVAGMKHDLRWLLWIATPLFLFTAFSLAKNWLRGKYLVVVVLLVSAAIVIAMIAVAKWLSHPEVSQLQSGQNNSASSEKNPPPTAPPVSVNGNKESHQKPKGRENSENSAPLSQTGGHDNTQIGSITQGNGSALSLNQRGGITAGTVIMDAPPDREWNLSSDQHTALCATPGEARIYSINDQEAIRFAEKIAKTLLSCKWKVPEFGTCQYTNTFGGVWIKTNPSDPRVPNLLASMQGDFPVKRGDTNEYAVGWIVINIGGNSPIKDSDLSPLCTLAQSQGSVELRSITLNSL